MQNELGIRSLRTLRKIMKCYSEDTVVRTLDLLEHEDGILALEKLMEKELPEKEFLKELKVIKKSQKKHIKRDQ
ncbi:MAG: hypothetical protein Q4A45_03235 [Clostridia bacterium]|nr:hypothetical protein [Clostridia bacterium]